MPRLACIWRAPFTTVHVLQQLPAGFWTDVRAITPDGSVVVGGAQDASERWKCVRWNTSTLAVTQLADVLPSQDCMAGLVSADASVIIGGHFSSTSSGSIGLTPMIRYTGGGTTGALLLDQTGGHGTDIEWGLGPCLGRRLSDDGSINTGNANNTNYSAPRWVSGAYSGLLGVASSSGSVGPQDSGCSRDGSVIVGQSGNNSFSTPSIACYWTGTTQRLLISSTDDTIAYFANADGSIIWGDSIGPPPLYWTNTSTPAGDGVHYGVVHAMDTDARITAVSDDLGATIAVGNSSSTSRAYKWNGTTATALPGLSSGNTSRAYGCNHDGSIVVGFSTDTGSLTQPVYWDASNAVHVLPSLADPTDFYQGEALGISRNGSVIFGLIDVVDVPPTPTPIPAPALSENLISLRWSDDRGHSWSNPVTQSIGDAGEYRTSLQWNRLGMCRDRVFELSWSTPTATALQGCWFDATPAQS